MIKNEFAGVLADFDEISRYTASRNPKLAIVNDLGAIQFYIKIISQKPANFPEHIKLVNAFDNNKLSNKLMTPEEFVEKYADYIFFFEVNVNVNHKGKHYNADIHSITKKSEFFNRDTPLIQIPLYNIDNTRLYNPKMPNVTNNKFERALKNGSSFPLNKQISTEKTDLPQLLVWYENNKYTFYSGLKDVSVNEYGIAWEFENITTITIDRSELFDCYIKDDVCYMPENKVTEIKKRLPEIYNHNSTNSEVKGGEITEMKTENLEKEFMDLFIQICSSRNLYYKEEDLYNFHTSIKNGNLVILAGMSGTGKSKLVHCYAEALKLNSEEQMLFIPVRPYWQDDADVIGYLDTMNNIYRPGDSGLVNLLFRAAKSLDKMFIVCFDEMNIARVEHYFSQLLSILELDDDKRELRLYNDDFSNIYNNQIYKPKVSIGKNVLFVGTVNLDESTYHFSDKVLDRANVLNLQIVPYDKIKDVKSSNTVVGEIAEKQRKLNITADCYNSFRKQSCEIELEEYESKILWDIHLKLQKYNRNIGIGWRIVNQISIYLNNLPEGSPLSRQEAFDLQIVQRVLTKIRGNSENLISLLGEYDNIDEPVKESEILEILVKHSDYNFKHTKKNLIDKSRELIGIGYTV